MISFKEYLTEDLGNPQTVIVTGKNKKEAYQHAQNKATRDWRGVKITRKSGGKWKVVLT